MTNNIDKIRAARREYHRKWRAEHPESVKAAQVRYWTKKAMEMQQEHGSQLETPEDNSNNVPG